MATYGRVCQFAHDEVPIGCMRRNAYQTFGIVRDRKVHRPSHKSKYSRGDRHLCQSVRRLGFITLFEVLDNCVSCLLRHCGIHFLYDFLHLVAELFEELGVCSREVLGTGGVVCLAVFKIRGNLVVAYRDMSYGRLLEYGNLAYDVCSFFGVETTYAGVGDK